MNYCSSSRERPREQPKRRARKIKGREGEIERLSGVQGNTCAAGGERQKLWGPGGKTGKKGFETSSEEGEAAESRNHGKRICIIRKTEVIRASQIGL